MNEEFYLPVLSHFQNGNGWTGSGGRLRYKVVPAEERLAAEVWEGPWCYELSRVEEKREFPMDEAGLEALSAWLQGWLAEMAGRGAPTLEETLRRRDEVRAAAKAEKTQ